MKKEIKITTVLAILLVLTLIFPIISAGTEDTLKISVYKISETTNTTTYRIYFNSTEFPVANSKRFEFTINNKTSESIGTKIYDSGNFYFVAEGEAEIFNFTKELLDCRQSLGQQTQGWHNCNQELEKFKSENVTQCKTDLDECNLLVKEKDLTISSKDSEISRLNTEIEENKNSKWIFGFIGLIAGAGGFYLYNKSKKGGGPAKDKSINEWNKNNAG